MRVVISAAAEADLETIGDWIARHSPARALSFVLELRNNCASLADAPEGYALVARYEHTGVRRKPHGKLSDLLLCYR
jgi:toxin ParE1/3/4